MTQRSHVAGVIPVANLHTDYNLDVPSVMLPVDAGFTCIQKSVFECAIAGCKTIWIVVDYDLAPIVRKSVGEWVHDPVYYNRTHVKFYKEVRKEIPIYYVPIRDRDRNRRDSYGWSVLHGIYSAWWVANRISKWLIPQKYFISFPMAAYNIYSIREHRKEIADLNANFFLAHNKKTVKDNIPLSFTMKGEDYLECRRKVNKTTSREYLPPLPGEIYPSQRLPLEQRWSARKFDFNLIFDKVSMKNSNIVEPEWFFDVSTWDGYRDYLGSSSFIKRPYKGLTGPHRHDRMITKGGVLNES
jgi:hypothetical protein